MSQKCFVAEFKAVAQAKSALELLIANGFSSDAVTMVWHDNEQALSKADLSGKGSLGEAADSAAFGGLMAASLASPIALGTALMPVLVVVPFAMFASGAVAGLLLYKIAHAGSHAETAKNYHQQLLQGGALIMVTGTSHRLHEAEMILRDLDVKSMEEFPVNPLPDS